MNFTFAYLGFFCFVFFQDSDRGEVTSDGERVESDEEDDYTYTEDETCTEYEGEGDSVIIEDDLDEKFQDGERQSGDGAEVCSRQTTLT